MSKPEKEPSFGSVSLPTEKGRERFALRRQLVGALIGAAITGGVALSSIVFGLGTGRFIHDYSIYSMVPEVILQFGIGAAVGAFIAKITQNPGA